MIFKIKQTPLDVLFIRNVAFKHNYAMSYDVAEGLLEILTRELRDEDIDVQKELIEQYVINWCNGKYDRQQKEPK